MAATHDSIDVRTRQRNYGQHVSSPPSQRSSKLVFAIEPMASFLKEGAPLFAKHREEVAKDKDVMILGVDEGYYNAGANAKVIVVVTARSRGKLVGYMLWLLYTHPHYKTVKCAQDDVHYLLPEYRKGLAGYLLLKNAISLVQAIGDVKYCYVREKIGHEHPAIMKRLGFSPMDITYSRKL